MKIVLFTPIVEASAIGLVSSLLLRELGDRGHDVVVVRSEVSSQSSAPIRKFDCDVVSWQEKEKVRQAVRQSDMVAYQIGNHYPYHAGCLNWMNSVPGIAMLHDNFLGHLFWAWSDHVGHPQAIKILTELYGDEVAQQFFGFHESDAFLSFASKAAPMTEWISGMAAGVLVHSMGSIDRITSACPGPVAVVSLPYNASGYLESNDEVNNFKDKSKLVVLTVGHVNPNKRAESVIRAIGSTELLRDRVSYRIIGLATPSRVEELNRLAQQLGVDVVITGEVNQDRLVVEINGADVMCCLRWPALESASASTIEAMLYAKPTLVSNTGFYASIPKDCVYKISLETEEADIANALKRMIDFPAERRALGKLARQYALKTFRVDTYVQELINMRLQIKQSKMIGVCVRKHIETLIGWGAGREMASSESLTSPLSIIS